MVHNANAGAGAAVAAAIAAQVRAIKACGTLLDVSPEDFLIVLALEDQPLVISSEGGVFSRHFRYLTPFRGLAFHCKVKEALPMPEGTIVIPAKKMVIPDVG